MKRNFLTIVIGAVLVVLAVLLLFMFQVRQSEVAVVTRFGRPVRSFTEPGARGKLPWPIEKVYKFDQRTQNFEDKFEQAFTSDNNNLLTMVYVGWRITDPKAFFPKFAGGSVAEAEKMLEGIIRSAKSAVVGRHPLSDFINVDASQLKFDAIETEMKQIVQSQLQTNNYGIQVEFLGIKKLGLPDSVTQSVFEQMTSERRVLSDRLEAEGLAEADKIRSSAERKANEMLAGAESQARQIRGRGEVVAAESLTVFQQNPELANFLLRLDALEASLKERSTLIFDQRTPPFDLFNGVPTGKSGK